MHNGRSLAIVDEGTSDGSQETTRVGNTVSSENSQEWKDNASLLERMIILSTKRLGKGVYLKISF